MSLIIKKWQNARTPENKFIAEPGKHWSEIHTKIQVEKGKPQQKKFHLFYAEYYWLIQLDQNAVRTIALHYVIQRNT